MITTKRFNLKKINDLFLVTNCIKTQNSDYFKFFLLAYLIDMICELKFSYKINLITWTYL